MVTILDSRRRRYGTALIAVAAAVLGSNLGANDPGLADDIPHTTTVVDLQIEGGGTVAAEVETAVKTRPDDGPFPSEATDATVTLRIPIPAYVTSMRVRLPELACPVVSEFVTNERFQIEGSNSVAFPTGVEPVDNADRVVRAEWAPHLADRAGLAVSLQAGSVVNLDAIEDSSVPAVFVMHCTSALSRSTGLGHVSQPPPVDLSVPVDHDFRLLPGIGATIVAGRLPVGLVLTDRGTLTGTVPPGVPGVAEFTLRLTDGSTMIDHRLEIRTFAKVSRDRTQSWTLQNRSREPKPRALGDILCPAERPWATSDQFHDPFWSPQKVPTGVQAVTSPPSIEVASQPVYDEAGRLRGMTQVFAAHVGIEDTGAVHFVLHCTNDANAAGRR